MKDIYLIRATLNDKFDRVKGSPYRTIAIGDKMLFLFDYGDEWTFELEFVEIAERMKHVKYPMVVDSFMKSPKQYGYH